MDNHRDGTPRFRSCVCVESHPHQPGLTPTPAKVVGAEADRSPQDTATVAKARAQCQETQEIADCGDRWIAWWFGQDVDIFHGPRCSFPGSEFGACHGVGGLVPEAAFHACGWHFSGVHAPDDATLTQPPSACDASTSVPAAVLLGACAKQSPTNHENCGMSARPAGFADCS